MQEHHRSTLRVLTGSGDVGYSQVVSMSGFGACGLSVLMVQLAGVTPDLNVTAQVSNDKQNWTDLSIGPASSQDVVSVGAAPLLPLTSIAAAYLRLKFTLTGDLSLFAFEMIPYRA